MSEVRVCFLGTPDFAASTLQSLLADDHYKVVGVVTQPDRPKGRSLQLTPSPVKNLALKNNIEVLTPESLKKQPEILEQIKLWKAEIAIVVAFGQILDQKFLDSFPLGCVNVHASLLPLWRGAAPIQRSLEAGDKVTGVCLQKMVLKLDAGDLLGQREIQLDDNINSLELHDRLATMGAELIKIELMDYIRGNLVPLPQDESKVTVAKKIDKAESKLDFTLDAKVLHNKARAFVWGPGVYAQFQNQRVKIHKTKVSSLEKKSAFGEVIHVSEQSFIIATGSGGLEILELQPESKNRITAADFINRFSVKIGDRFE